MKKLFSFFAAMLVAVAVNAQEIPSTDFAAPGYTFTADAATIIGNPPADKVYLDETANPHHIAWSDVSKAIENAVIWKINATRGCYVTVSLDLGPVIASNKHIFCVEIFDANGARVDTIAEGPNYTGNGFTDHDEVKVLDGQVLIPAAGEYTIQLKNNRDWSKGSIKNVILTYAADAPEPQHTYTVAGAPATLFGKEWNASYAENDMESYGTDTYFWRRDSVALAAGNVEFKIVEDHSWSKGWPDQNYVIKIDSSGIYNITISFKPKAEVADSMISVVVYKVGDAVVLPKIILHGEFTGSWADTEEFAVAEDNLTASLKLNLTAGSYQFGMKFDGVWKANGAELTRANASTSLREGNLYNMKITADVDGEYIFTYTFLGEQLTVTCPPIITYIFDSQMGTIQGPKTTATGVAAENITFEAISKYGYHFVQWNDSMMDNPRTIWLSQDTTFTAEFAKNTYSISTTSANPEWGTTAGDTAALYLDEVEISAIPNYGYHFLRWNDYNTSNPRTVSVTEDKTYTATFAKNVYSITKNAEHGTISGNSSAEYLDFVTLTATPDYGYHFTQWSDGNTDNPRTITLTSDTTFTAQFAKNTYTISTTSANPEWGITAGDTAALYLDEVEISATANYGYRFLRWNDYNTSNPRTISVTEDKTYTATFAKNVYSITKNAEHGSISGNSSAEYLDFVTLTVTPDYGYHFIQWSDGLKDNPRIFQITSDTTFTAEFAYDRVGTCGKDLALVWSYDPTNKVLTIGNAGSFTENMQFGVEAPTEMEELVIGNSVTAIGANAFAGIETLKKVSIGESVKTIGEQAFYNCVNLETIFNYRPTPTNTYSNAFDGVDKFECTLYVLPNSIDMYKAAAVWRDFYYTYAIEAEEATVTTNDVTVEPQSNAATLTWPTSNNAASYTIQITKDGVVFCTLIFNGNGQLTGIAFAPSRDGSRHAPSALMTANGLQFTVTGLDSNTQYGYSVTAKDANDQTVATYSGEFTTTSEGTATGIEDVQGNNVQCTKVIRNGQIFILRSDNIYTLTGQEVK